MLKEFKEFIMRGSLIDFAVGIIVGGAFGKLISSLVNDIIMPPIGLLLGGVNFVDLFWTLKGEEFATLAGAQEAGAVTMNYGVFVNTIIEFLIIAFVIFLLIKQINRMRREQEIEETPAELTTKECGFCFTQVPLQATRCPHCTSELG